MRILCATMRLHTPWVRSLKEKRGIVKPLLHGLRTTFNVSVCERDAQDAHHTVVFCIVGIAQTQAQAARMAEQWQRYVESHTDAELLRADFEER